MYSPALQEPEISSAPSSTIRMPFELSGSDTKRLASPMWLHLAGVEAELNGSCDATASTKMSGSLGPATHDTSLTLTFFRRRGERQLRRIQGTAEGNVSAERAKERRLRQGRRAPLLILGLRGSPRPRSRARAPTDRLRPCRNRQGDTRQVRDSDVPVAVHQTDDRTMTTVSTDCSG